MIVVGALIFLIASMGCLGAIRESYCLLMTFAVCLVVIFLIEIGVGTASAVYQDNFIRGLNETVKGYEMNADDRNSWDTLHRELKCCGINGPDTWQGQQVPVSCCHENDESKTLTTSTYCQDRAQGKFIYSEGCLDKLKAEINANSKILIGVGIGIAFVEVAGIFLSCWLACIIKKKIETNEN
ncbi:hypothetical protein HHI36_008869 [Cryptolaemus montrouzieri]|uniref:Tetraspanin n=1 Tax=Cryptolaemus montrouzieri TaxID=559131 RepID=A0ABD2MTR5_9CUCU